MSPDLERAVAALRAGGLVAFPTETVYGLGADAANASAVGRLYDVKGRPANHPVIVHVHETASLDDYAVDVPDVARELARAFWPGPLTMVVRRRPDKIVEQVSGGLATVGIRVPDHPLAQELLGAFAGPVAAPSANRFGRVSPTTADHVRSDLGADVDVVLDGGPCVVGVESTIVDVSGAAPVVLRVGGVTDAALEQVLGQSVTHETSGRVAAPGTLAAHYAPLATVELVYAADAPARARELAGAGKRVALLSLEALDGVEPYAMVLPRPVDIDDYARVLYSRLREADRHDVDFVLAVPPPAGGLGDAVSDRLQRAAGGSVESR